MLWGTWDLSSPTRDQMHAPCNGKESESRSVVSDSCDSTDCIVHGIFQARLLEWVAFPSPGDLPNSGTEPRSPALQVNSLPAKPQGKPSLNQSYPCNGSTVLAISPPGTFQKGMSLA